MGLTARTLTDVHGKTYKISEVGQIYENGTALIRVNLTKMLAINLKKIYFIKFKTSSQIKIACS